MKLIFLYRVDLGRNGHIDRTEFCYARNKTVAQEYYKEKYRKEQYNTIKFIAFGTADPRRHPLPFQEMSQEELNYIISNNIGDGGPYPFRSSLPSGGEFVPVEKAGS